MIKNKSDIDRLIDYYIQIEEYKRHIKKQQLSIGNEVKKYIIEMYGDNVVTKYSIAELIEQKPNKNRNLQHLKNLVELNLFELIDITEGKALMTFLAKQPEMVEAYRNYILNSDKKENKVKLVKYLIENKQEKLLILDKEIINNIVIDEIGNYSDAQVKTIKYILKLKKESPKKKLLIKKR